MDYNLGASKYVAFAITRKMAREGRCLLKQALSKRAQRWKERESERGKEKGNGNNGPSVV